MDFQTAFDPQRALGVAYRLIKRAPLTLILGGFLLFLTDIERRVGVQYHGGFPTARELLGIFWVTGGPCFLGLSVFLANSFLRIGYVGALQRVLVTGEERTADLFQGRGLFLSMLLARAGKWLCLILVPLPFTLVGAGCVALAQSLGNEGVGILAAVLFGLLGLCALIFVGSGLLLVEEAVAIEGLDPGAALQRSWSLARGRRGSLVFYAFVMGLIQFLGGLLCCMTACLGWILMPLARSLTAAAWTESYLRFALPEPEGGNWADRDPMAGPVRPSEPAPSDPGQGD